MIKLVKSTFYKEEETRKKLAEFIQKSNWLSFGRECEKFERNFAKWQGRKHCVFVNSGSSANLALIQSLLNLGKIKQGDRVGFSAITWSTNVMPLIQLGLEPIPIDIELDTLNVSSDNLSAIIKNYSLKAFFFSILLGFCADIKKIRDICRKNNIILLEDNCEALGSIYQGKKLGNFGLASTFSFYVGHHLSTIEGGAVCTDDDQLATILRVVRAHGWDRNLAFVDRRNLRRKFKVNSQFYSRYIFYDLGYNLRPTEIAGFLGNVQLCYLDRIVQKRYKNFLKLADALYRNKKNYYPIKYDHLDFISNFAFPLICKTTKQRNELVRKCRGKVEIRPIVGGDITSQPFFAKYSRKENYLVLNAKIAREQGIYFGNNPELTDKEIEKIIALFV